MAYRTQILAGKTYVMVPQDEWRSLQPRRVNKKSSRSQIDDDPDWVKLTPAEAKILKQAKKEIAEGLVYPHDVLGKMIDGMHPVKAFRQHYKMTQQQLADKSGLSKISISSIEQRCRAMSHDVMRAIAKALGIKPALLVENDDD